MNIGNCELLDAIGSSSPMYYIVGWNASQEEINSKIIFDPFSNDGNKYLHSTLSSLGVANSVRFNKVLKFNNVIWNPSENQLNLSRKQLNQDIIESNPRVIVALGGKTAEFLLGNKFVSLSNQAGKNLKCEIDGKEFSLVITYSPEFLVKDESSDSENEELEIEDTQSIRNRQKFINDLLYAGKIANGEISDLSAKNLVTAKTYEEFYDYYEKNIKDAVYVAYDIETNAQPVHFDTFRIIGFSLSADPMSGVYVIRESLDYVIPDPDWEKIVKLAVSIIDSHKIIVHNCMYEIPSTLNNWKYRIKEFDDTMIMSRLLLGGKTGAGLKEQCQINLGYPEWEEDLTSYREIMDHFRNIMKPTPAGKQRWYYTFMVDHDCSLFEMRDELLKYNKELTLKLTAERDAGDISQEDYEKKIYDKVVNSKESDVISKISSLEVLIRSYYPDDSDFYNMMHSIGKEMVNLVESNNFGFMPYSSVPSRLLSKYGAIDAVGTRELFDNLSERLDKESTSDVDLWTGYRIMKAQFKVGVSMEMNGLYWDDSVAESEYTWFNAKAIESMRNLVNSGYLDDKMFWSCRECWIKYLIDNNPDELKNLIGEDFYLTEKGIKKVSGGREILFRNVPNLISESYWNENKEFFLNYIKKIEVYDDSKYKWYSDFKYIYNPASPKQEEFLTGITVTDDIRIANVLYLFTLILEDKESGWERYSDNDRKPFELIKSIQDYNSETLKYNETEEGQKNPKELISNGELFDKFKELISTQMFYSKDLNQKLIDGLNYKLENAQEGSILFLYKLYTIVGKDDIEKDRSTWTPGFRFLVDFRSYKKCIKMMTTYITGAKVGRGSVTEVSREDIDNNVELPLRHSYYSGNKSNDSEYLMQSKFNICGTDTFRWRSGLHTIPGDATIKNVYRSRYKGGVIFAPDYSQAEIRMIAGLSNCKTMIDAFINGLDIHRFNACFTGDTKVCLADGRRLTFEELVEEYGNSDEKFWVYSVDSNDNITMGQAHHPRKTLENAKVLEVELDNGVKIKCTPNHLWRTRSGYKSASELQVGDSITPLYTKYDNHGYQLYYDLVSEEFKYTHQMSADILDNTSFSGMVRHHINYNKKDNRPNNLIKMNYSDHTKLHQDNSKQLWSYESNHKRSETMKRKYREGISEQGNSEARKKRCAEIGKEFLGTGGKFQNDPKYAESRKRVLDQGLKNLEVARHNPERIRKAREGILNSEKEIERRREHMRNLRSNPISRCNSVLGKYSNRVRNNLNCNYSKIAEYLKLYSELNNVSLEETLNKWDVFNINDITSILYYNHKVVSIRELDETYDVYDLTVDKYHNFAIDTSDGYNESAVFVHNSKIFQIPIEEVTSAQRRYAKMFSFSILYGSTPEGAANDYLNGDVALAKSIFEDFYRAFPEIKDFIAEMHDRMHKYGKVPVTKTGMFIKIDPSDFRGDVHKAERAAQNYPVQSCSSDVAGYVLSKANDYLLDNGMKSKTVLFIHDSLEFDVYPYEMLDLADYLIHKMNDIPMQEFGVPMKIDLALGVSMGQEVEMSKLELSEDKRSCTCVIEGLEEDFNLLVENWKDIYSVVEWEDLEEPSDIYIPKGNLFLAKVAISHKLGKKQREIKRKVKIAY